MADREITVEITALGARGDGIAETADGRVFVPFAAPGDRLRVRLVRDRDMPRGDIIERLADGPDRAAPCCSHFTVCGGCVAQHLSNAAYRDWKRGIVRAALAHRGIDPAVVGPLSPGGPGRRRRARLRARRTVGGVVLGFYEARSHRIVDLAECPVTAARIVALFGPLRGLFAALLAAGEGAEAAATLCAAGLDLTIAAPGEPDLAMRERLAEFADVHDLARLNWQRLRTGRGVARDIQTVVRRRAAEVRFGPVAVEPPPDAFLQPTVEGEAVLRDGAMAALAGAGRIADLYAGCGAFALPLAAMGAHVAAFDSAADHIAALEAGARLGGLGEFVAAETRDLDRRPLTADTLASFDGVVLDPPRGGAAAQVRQLAEGAAPTIVYVSCNPASFARDARALIDGGYALESVLPVDQFLYTPHMELVGVFRKAR